MTEILYKDLSYKLTGFAYEIDNKIGYGHSESTYGDAFEELLKQENIVYKREVYFPITIDEKVIKKAYFDFLVDNNIVIELKIADHKYKDACTQLFRYLKASNLKLGIIFRFTKDGVKTKRIPNYF